nr:hypothetical protein [Tabrizicola sp.]
GALAEATAPPAPEGTLEFQAEAMASVDAAPATATPEEAAAVAEALAEAALTEMAEGKAVASAEAPVEGTTDAAIALAANDVATVAPAAEPGTLEAQAAALKSPLPETLVAEAAPAETALDPALAGLRPKARPEALVAPQLAEIEVPVAPAPEEIVVAEAAQELVVTDPGTEPAAEAPATLLADITDVETVAGATAALPTALALADAAAVTPMPKRQAPIFDAVQADASVEPQAEAEEEVVVVMSTSGGRHFGVNVGEFPSRYDAEKALLKTALAESATLNEGRRKTTQSGGIWHASFMGLTEEQAELACRRLTARAIPCETVGG